MSISRNPSDYQVKSCVIQKVKDCGLEMKDVADAIENGDVAVNNLGEGFALIEGTVPVGLAEIDITLYISTDEVPKAEINRMKVHD